MPGGLSLLGGKCENSSLKTLWWLSFLTDVLKDLCVGAQYLSALLLVQIKTPALVSCSVLSSSVLGRGREGRIGWMATSGSSVSTSG